MQTKKFKTIPNFKDEDAERDFWATHDTTEYLDWSKAEHFVFPNLKPTSKPISIRIPDHMINRLKVKANEIDIPYQSLIKQFINQGLQTV
jgi:predicted DNA binding CopG/RHH family protein